MKKNLMIKIVLVLALVTAVFAAVHLSTRQAEEAGAIQVSFQGKMTSVPLWELPLQDVSGITVNGKGEEKTVQGRGTPLSDVLAQAGVDLSSVQQVAVVAADEFSAVLTLQEVTEEGKAYLLQEEGEECLRLAVFGDPDSKRQVRNAVRIEVE